MSLFRQVLGVAAPIVGGMFGGPIGAAAGMALAGAIQKPAPAPLQVSGPAMPSAQFTQTMGALPPVLGRALPAVGGAVIGMGVRGATAIARSAMTYCRRHPQWCATIGGTAAVSAMIQSGQLPTIRRRRGRGITPKDLRSFRRVANLVRGYCPTVRRIPSRQLHVRRTGITHAG